MLYTAWLTSAGAGFCRLLFQQGLNKGKNDPDRLNDKLTRGDGADRLTGTTAQGCESMVVPLGMRQILRMRIPAARPQLGYGWGKSVAHACCSIERLFDWNIQRGSHEYERPTRS